MRKLCGKTFPIIFGNEYARCCWYEQGHDDAHIAILSKGGGVLVWYETTSETGIHYTGSFIPEKEIQEALAPVISIVTHKK